MSLKNSFRNAVSPPHHPDHEQTDLKEDDRGDGEKALCHDIRRRGEDRSHHEREENDILSSLGEHFRCDEACLCHGDEDDRYPFSTSITSPPSRMQKAS